MPGYGHAVPSARPLVCGGGVTLESGHELGLEFVALWLPTMHHRLQIPLAIPMLRIEACLPGFSQCPLNL